MTTQPVSQTLSPPLSQEPPVEGMGCLDKIKKCISDFFKWLCNFFSSQSPDLKDRVGIKNQENPESPIVFDAQTLLFYQTLSPLKTIGQTEVPTAETLTATQRLKSAITEADKADNNEDPAQYQSLCYKRHVEQIKDIYTKYFSRRYEATPMMGLIHWVPGNFGLWMPGVALVVSHYRQKYGLKEFYACATLEGFSNKLGQCIQDPQVQRAAFVVPSFSSGTSADFTPNFAQHKVAVVVQKTDSGSVKIALLNAQKNGNVEPEKVEGQSDGIWQGWQHKDSFNSQEVVFRAILKAQLSPNSKLFFANISREGHYGCESFAIQDCLAFLRDPLFFDKVILAVTTQQLNGFSLETISKLPLAFMTGMQSLKTLNHVLLLKKPPELVVKTKEGRDKSLKDYRDKYTINGRNHYITVKSCRYNEIVLQMLKELPRTAIDQRLAETLVV